MRIRLAISIVFLASSFSTGSQQKELKGQLEQAQGDYLAGQYPRAAVRLTALVTKLELSPAASPERSLLIDAHFYLALSLFALDDAATAKESFKAIARLEPDFQIDPERYAPQLLDLFEEARSEIDLETPAAYTSSSSGKPAPKLTVPILAAVGAGAGVAAVARGGSEDAPGSGDPLAATDNDGDGFSVSAGDCNDSDPTIRPGGMVSFNVRFAFSGTVGCQRTNPRQQVYTIENKSCEAFTFSHLEWQARVVDSLERTTDSLSTILAVERTTIEAGESATIRSGPPGGTSRALCRDLAVANPFSRPRGNLRVDETYFIRTLGGTDLVAENSFMVLNTQECSFCSLDSIFGPYPSGGDTLHSRSTPTAEISWQNELAIEGARGEVIVNDGAPLLIHAGSSLGRMKVLSAEIRFEAQLIEGLGRSGTWTFDFASAPTIEPGSLRVLEGEVASLTSSAVAFHMKGTTGERIVFLVRAQR